MAWVTSVRWLVPVGHSGQAVTTRLHTNIASEVDFLFAGHDAFLVVVLEHGGGHVSIILSE